MVIPRKLPKPMFVRPNDFVSISGQEYIIKRNEFGQMVKVIGRVSRKLPSEKDIIWALTAGRKVAQWGMKYFMIERISEEIIDPLKEEIWEADVRRGVPKPDLSDATESEYDFS